MENDPAHVRSGLTWQSFTRSLVASSWKPCICIQGGGAKGSWEAGVLATLLKSPKTSRPVALWGTSAGAINALWASTLRADCSPDKLLDLWCAYASTIRRSVGLILLLLALLGSLLLLAPARLLIEVTSFVIVGVALFVMMFVHWRKTGAWRLPGLFPVWMCSRLLPKVNAPANWFTYMCCADANLRDPPAAWDWETLACFVLSPGSIKAELLNSHNDFSCDPRLAASASAGLPFLCRPLLVERHALLDGGLEANLPAGFIMDQGMLGGNCAICIVPKPIAHLNPQDHVDYRVLRFLSDLKTKQSAFRASGQSSHPAHTFRPILLVCPRSPLTSGLLAGFFLPWRLKDDFDKGCKETEYFLEALCKFRRGTDAALDRYLLERAVLPDLTGSAPRPAWWWRPWANLRW